MKMAPKRNKPLRGISQRLLLHKMQFATRNAYARHLIRVIEETVSQGGVTHCEFAAYNQQPCTTKLKQRTKCRASMFDEKSTNT